MRVSSFLIAVPLAATLPFAACSSTREASAEETAVQAASAQTGATAAADPAQCRPLETRPANGAGQQPAFPGQTRGCGVQSSAPYDVQVVARGLVKPWAVEPMPNGSFLVTEKGGQMRIVSASGQVGQPIAGLPAVDARGQGGLLDVALSPRFVTDRTVFWTFTEPRTDGNGTSVGRGVLSADGSRLERVRVILHTIPSYTNNMHFGSRLAFGSDGMLFVTMGERSDTITRPQAQQMNSHFGKVLRITTDGAPAPGNPYIGHAQTLPEIWSAGHRNVQAAAVDPQGGLWVIEHGTRGGDEVNRVQRGKNYGWPLQAYGIEYQGGPIRSRLGPAATQRTGMEQPVYYWDPVIAPSGAQYYTGSLFPAWRNSLFIGGLASMRLVRVQIENGRVVREEHLLADRNKRIRDVRQGPDGALYVVTDDQAGELWKIVPRR
jgi:glucose/arabinose dehydrogenase